MRNQWISVYIYSSLSLDNVIINPVNTIITELERMRYLGSYFFIRYWDPREHIRLRILPRLEEDIPAIKNIIVEQAASFFNDTKICQQHHLEFVPYHQEIDRYGGANGMEVSESLFEYSSKTTMTILKEFSSVWSNSLAMSFAIKMHAIMMKTIIGHEKVVAEIFRGISENWLMHSVRQNEFGGVAIDDVRKVEAAFDTTYIAQKAKITRIVEDVLALENSVPDHTWEAKWRGYCQIVNDKINSEEGIASIHLALFCDSHVHMTNNRLGVYLRDESFIAFMLYKIFTEKAFS